MKMSPAKYNIDAKFRFTQIHKFSCPNTNDFIPVVGSPHVASREGMQVNKENKTNFPNNNFYFVCI